MKRCSKCKNKKSFNNFYRDSGRKDGHRPHCKQCISEYTLSNKEKKRIYDKRRLKRLKKTKEYKEKVNKWTKLRKESGKTRKYYIDNIRKLSKYRDYYRKLPSIYNSYATKLSWCEKVRRDPENNDYLQVRCTEVNCKKWFNPTNLSVQNRIGVLNGRIIGECRFYCSEECKKSCSIYHQISYQKGFINNSNTRQDQSEWRSMVLERDNHTCQRCGETKGLIAHHIEGLNQNPVMSADVDIGITLCKKCDKRVHSEVGCRPIDLTKQSLCS